MKSNNFFKIFLFIFTLSIICAFLLSLSHTLLKNEKEQSIKVDKCTELLLSAKVLNYDGFFLKEILKCHYEIATFDKKTKSITNQTYQYRDRVTKKSGSDVSTTIFFDDFYNNLSAILFSNVDSANRSKLFGQDYILIHNHRANNPVREAIIKRGVEYRVKEFSDKFELSSSDL